jgi:hypothetical protein
MRIIQYTVTSKTGKEMIVHKYEDGRFASKAEYEAQELKVNTKPKRKKKVTPAEEVLASLDKTEEWQGEVGTYAPAPDIEEKYTEEVKQLEDAIEKDFVSLPVETPTEIVEEPKKGFFATWFKKWGW